MKSLPQAPVATKKAKIIRRTIWGVGIAAGLAAALWWTGVSAHGEPLAAISGVLALLGAYELSRMGGVRALGITAGLLTAGVFALLVCFSAGGLLPEFLDQPVRDKLTPNIVALLTLLPATMALVRPDRVRGPWHLRMLAAGVLGLWVTFAFVRMHDVWAPPTGFGHAAFVSLLILSKIGDIAGYYVGSAIGKSHPFKRISPGKTTAGCVASLLVTMVFAVGLHQLGWLAPEGYAPLWAVAAWGAAINLAAQAGDLFESWVKRRAAVKDSGTWFGPSGGVLDLVDSLLFTIPVAYFFWPFLLGAG